jgi:hypothetical protein
LQHAGRRARNVLTARRDVDGVERNRQDRGESGEDKSRPP